MTYILYGDTGSGSATVEMALAEIGAAVALRDVPLGADAQRSAEHRAINPMGRIPALILPDGTVLTESVAILVTLADRHPEAALLPAPGETARAVALRWMLAAATELYPAVTRSDYPERFVDGDGCAASVRAKAREEGRAFWTAVERVLAPSPFALGARFSVADIYLAVLSRWMGGGQWMPAECPRVEALATAVAARERAGPVFRKHFQTQ